MSEQVSYFCFRLHDSVEQTSNSLESWGSLDSWVPSSSRAAQQQHGPTDGRSESSGRGPLQEQAGQKATHPRRPSMHACTMDRTADRALEVVPVGRLVSVVLCVLRWRSVRLPPCATVTLGRHGRALVAMVERGPPNLLHRETSR